MKRYPNAVLTSIVIVWLVATVVGLSAILTYENTAGRSQAPPTTWPAKSEILQTSGMYTLVMMIHPHCPCSRSSIGELSLLMTEVQGLVNAHVVFVKPRDLPADWDKTDLWTSAEMIPGVKVTVDDAGVEAQRFDSHTSGQVVLYDSTSQLVFSGGITAARGHSGDNNGRRAIASILTTGNSELRETPVFGCPLFSLGASEETEDSCDANHSK